MTDLLLGGFIFDMINMFNDYTFFFLLKRLMIICI